MADNKARRRRRGQAGPEPAARAQAQGGTWRPMCDQDCQRMAEAAIQILTDIGVSQAPPIMCEAITAAGGKLHDGRLLFSQAQIADYLMRARSDLLLAGQRPEHDLKVGGTAVYAGTGGAAPYVADQALGGFRPSSLADLYQAARLADALEHLQFFARSLVARDIDDPLRLDLSTAAACLMGTAKHVMVQASQARHVEDIAALCYRVAGGEAAFRARPFLSLNVNHAVPPLRMHAEAIEVMAAAARAGIPVHANVFGQLGASSPVTLAGSVAQTLAETLAGLVFLDTLVPGAAAVAGPRAMITDLRSGGMAGGAGEQVLATGMAVQVLRLWDLPCSVIAGATDSKRADFQAGYEKAMTIASAAQAGANLITQAAGTQAGLMAMSPAAMVADNDMLGAVLRSLSPVVVDEETLALASIKAVVEGEGHFLGQPETYARMRSDFLYPKLADRSALEAWMAAPTADMEARAWQQARALAKTHWPTHGDLQTRRAILQDFGFPSGETE